MVETNITRRRVIQGTGVVGIAGVAGSTAVTAQQDENGEADQAAFRVAHASPDAPSVDVRLRSDGARAEDGGDDDPTIEDVGFRDVSGYTEIDPGTYRAEVVATDGGLLDDLLDLFDGDDDEEQVLFEEEIDVEAGTTYTAVAFGEVARGPADQPPTGDDNATGGTPGQDDNLTDGNATGGTPGQDDTQTAPDGALIEGLAFGEHQSFELDAGDHTLEVRETEAPTDGLGGARNGAPTDDDNDTFDGNDTAGGGDAVGDDETPAVDGDGGVDDRAFQVEILEDDLTDPGEERSRLRVFHAVPDVDAVSIFQVEDEGAQDDNATGGTPGQDDNATDGNATDGTPGQDDAEAPEDDVRRVEISPRGRTAYSGFAVGYFDPQAAARAGEDDNATDGNATDGNLTDGNLTDGASGQDGNATDGNATDGNATDGDELAQDAEGEEFELVTVADSENGERADGGTNGFFNLATTN